MRKIFIYFIYCVLTSVAALLIIDALLGKALFKIFVDESFIPDYRIQHRLYHHTLAPNVDVLERWGFDQYRLCTDGSGFKGKCGAITRKDFDLAILGDSFIEGIGLPYEKTLAGMIAEAQPNFNIANLGVATYSPSIYLVKFKHLLSQGYTFKELHVYVDIGDIQDEAIRYEIDGGRVVPRNEHHFLWLLKADLHSIFPLTYTGLSALKGILIDPKPSPVTFLDRSYRKTGWTWDNSIDGYEPMGVDASIKTSINAMEELFIIAKSNNIKMSVGVYPWAGQLLYDKRESRQVKIWRDFCERRCEYFFNSFPPFFDKVELEGINQVLARYFLQGDLHYNELGNRMLADTYFNTVAKAKIDHSEK